MKRKHWTEYAGLDAEQSEILVALWNAKPKWWQFRLRSKIRRYLKAIYAEHPKLAAMTGNRGTR